MPAKAVIFDLFDTLIDLYMERLPIVKLDGQLVPSTYAMLHEALGEFEPIPFDRFVRELRAVDRAQNRQRHAEGIEVPTALRFAQFCEALELEPRAEIAARLTQVHMGAIHGASAYLAHHANVLEKLGRRAKLAVCSNFSHSPTALAMLEESGLAPYFDTTVISHDVGLRKPRREIFEHTLERLGVAPEHVLHVGDNLDADITGASALGLRTVWITRRVPDPAKALGAHAGPQPTWTIADLDEMQSVLELADRD